MSDNETRTPWPSGFDLKDVLWAAHSACVDVAFTNASPSAADFSAAVRAAITSEYRKRGGIETDQSAAKGRLIGELFRSV